MKPLHALAAQLIRHSASIESPIVHSYLPLTDILTQTRSHRQTGNSSDVNFRVIEQIESHHIQCLIRGPMTNLFSAQSSR